MNEQHLFDENARSERAFCGADSSTDDRLSVGYYLEQRKNGHEVGSVCQECKALAMTLAGEIIEAAIEEHEAKGWFDMAEDYHELAKTLARETGQNSLVG